jgi:hypothetical protein
MLELSSDPPYKAYDLHLSKIGLKHLRPSDLFYSEDLTRYFDQLKYGDIIRVHGDGYMVEIRAGFERRDNGHRNVAPRRPGTFARKTRERQQRAARSQVEAIAANKKAPKEWADARDQRLEKAGKL